MPIGRHIVKIGSRWSLTKEYRCPMPIGRHIVERGSRWSLTKE